MSCIGRVYHLIQRDQLHTNASVLVALSIGAVPCKVGSRTMHPANAAGGALIWAMAASDVGQRAITVSSHALATCADQQALLDCGNPMMRSVTYKPPAPAPAPPPPLLQADVARAAGGGPYMRGNAKA